jgi:hypothetical protein
MSSNINKTRSGHSDDKDPLKKNELNVNTFQHIPSYPFHIQEIFSFLSKKNKTDYSPTFSHFMDMEMKDQPDDKSL